MITQKTHPAMLWEKREGGKVQCFLCPWECLIAEGNVGVCQVRQNLGGELVSLNYYRICAANEDPIEKKPLFHFMPNTLSFSVACVGCNLRCDFCQNWQISQVSREEQRIAGQGISPENIVSYAQVAGCRSISYTYTEPTIFFEFAYDTGKLAHQAGLKNVFVSNGYSSLKAYELIEPYLDAVNVDLKSFNEDYYHRRCHAHLEPVKNSLRWLAKSRIWLEVTTLIVPDENDSEDELKQIADFIAGELGPHVPWHISRFYPAYKMADTPVTPTEKLEQALQIGRDAGLRYCYGGNIVGHPSEDTFCHHCNRLLIDRWGYTVNRNDIVDNQCPQCGTAVDGVEMSRGSA